MTIEELLEQGDRVLYMEFDSDRPGGASEICAYRVESGFWIDAEGLDGPVGPYASLEEGLGDEGMLEIRPTLQLVESPIWSAVELAARLTVGELARRGQSLKLNGEPWVVTEAGTLARK